MGPDATGAELEFAAMHGPLSRLAIPIGLVWPKQSDILFLAGGPTCLFGANNATAQNQKHQPSHRPFAHFLEMIRR